MLNEALSSIMNDLDKEYKDLLRDYRNQWKLISAQIELQKELHPESSKALDNYMETLKTIISESIIEDENEENAEELKHIIAYVFGENEKLDD